MHCQHLVSTFAGEFVPSIASLGPSRRCAPWPAHLVGMDTNLARGATDTDRHQASLEGVLTLSELAALLCVSVRTPYDLRSQGRGPGLSGWASSSASGSATHPRAPQHPPMLELAYPSPMRSRVRRGDGGWVGFRMRA